MCHTKSPIDELKCGAPDKNNVVNRTRMSMHAQTEQWMNLTGTVPSKPEFNTLHARRCRNLKPPLFWAGRHWFRIVWGIDARLSMCRDQWDVSLINLCTDAALCVKSRKAATWLPNSAMEMKLKIEIWTRMLFEADLSTHSIRFLYKQYPSYPCNLLHHPLQFTLPPKLSPLAVVLSARLE